MKRYRAFTLAEIIITISIIGALAILTIAIANNSVPNKEMVMLKKAYFLTSRAVNELINDEDFYPETSDDNSQGFAHTMIGPQGTKTREEEAKYHGQTYSGNQKFCGLVATKLNLTGDETINERCAKRISLDEGGNFTTTDGVVWSMPSDPDGSFQKNNNTETIYIDVNGIDNGKNCGDSITDSGINACKEPNDAHDRFAIKISSDGAITVPSEIAREYLRTQKTNKSFIEIKNELEKKHKAKEEQENENENPNPEN